jgi:hypothetical protein
MLSAGPRDHRLRRLVRWRLRLWPRRCLWWSRRAAGGGGVCATSSGSLSLARADCGSRLSSTRATGIGPEKLWAKFDEALDQLGIALEGDGFAELAAVFGSLSAAATDIADALEQTDQVRQTG